MCRSYERPARSVAYAPKPDLLDRRRRAAASSGGVERLRSALGSKTTAYVETEYGHGWELLRGDYVGS